MSFNLFSDPELAQRQASLNSQWYALYQTTENCQMTAASQPWLSQFAADYYQWQQFFESGSDWSSDSKHATDAWQSKLQEHAKQAANFCGQSQRDDSGGNAYIPGVKDPPPDRASDLWGKVKETVSAPFNWVEGLATKLGILLAVVIGAVLFAIIYVSIKGSVKAGPISVGA